jgi:hypothetical protein
VKLSQSLKRALIEFFSTIMGAIVVALIGKTKPIEVLIVMLTIAVAVFRLMWNLARQ